MKKDKYFGFSNRIAKWKINTPIENWLSYKADDSSFWKSIYVFFYLVNDRQYFKKGILFINKIIDNYPYLAQYNRNFLIKDMIYCLHRFGISFEDYAIYNFVNRTNCNRNEFVSDKLRHYYADLLNDKSIKQLLDDKYKCFLSYKEFYKRDVVGCYNPNDYELFIEFIEKHQNFIYKPINDNCGHGVQSYYIKCKDKANIFFNEKISKGPFVCEEIISQGQELAILHPNSINTLRVNTIVIEKEVLINAMILRIGVGNSIVDNAGSGGIYASIDYKNGIIQSSARDYRGNYFNFHPDSNVQIIGYMIPEWEECLKTIKKIALKVKGTNLVSWDLAYSDKGWIMVEGNTVGSWDVLQSNLQIGLKPLLFSRIDKFFSHKTGEID